MENLIAHIKIERRWIAAALAVAAMVAGIETSTLVHAQSAPAAAAAVPVAPAPSREALSWNFGVAQSATGEAWTAERGSLSLGNGEARLTPDANRRVVLVSPPGLPESARDAEKFVVQVLGSGLQRVRIQARRDARGGWITIADASGSALLSTAAGYVIKRKPGTRDGSIERLRIELEFRTTNPRELKRIAVIPARP